MTRPVAVSVMPLQNRRETIVRLATEAERAGYDSLYLLLPPNLMPAQIDFALDALR